MRLTRPVDAQLDDDLFFICGRVQLLLVNWDIARAKLVKLVSKAHIFDTGPPDVGADGKDYRANSVHAPFPDKSQHAERPLAASRPVASRPRPAAS